MTFSQCPWVSTVGESACHLFCMQKPQLVWFSPVPRKARGSPQALFRRWWESCSLGSPIPCAALIGLYSAAGLRVGVEEKAAPRLDPGPGPPWGAAGAGEGSLILCPQLPEVRLPSTWAWTDTGNLHGMCRVRVTGR